jgi:hypothetical protein
MLWSQMNILTTSSMLPIGVEKRGCAQQWSELEIPTLLHQEQGRLERHAASTAIRRQRARFFWVDPRRRTLDKCIAQHATTYS